ILLISLDADIDRRGITRLRHERDELLLVLRRRDMGEIRLERREPARLDPRVVHPRRVEIADLTRDGIIWAFGGILDDLAQLQLGIVGHVVIISGTDLVGRDRMGPQPGPLGKTEEIVARLYAAIHVAIIDAPRTIFRLGT